MNAVRKGRHKHRKALAEIRPEHLECRDLLHAWRHYSAKRVGKGFEETLQCSRCILQKTRKYNSKGEIVGSSRYHYPPGYVIPGLGRLSKEERGEIRLRRMLQNVTD